MRRHFLAGAILTAGCTSWQKRDCYENGPCVVKTSRARVIEHCWIPGRRDDHGQELSSRNTTACYDKRTREIWLSWDRLTDVFHELCHYFCSPDKMTDCDMDCDKHNESGRRF